MSKILIIEPNDAVREALVRELHDAGIEATAAMDLPSARGAMQHEHPSLIFLDVSDENQEPLIQLMKLKEAYPGTQVIVTAALASTETAVEAMKLNAADFLMKPYSLDKIVARVESILQRSDDSKEGASSSAEVRSLPKAIGRSPAIRNILLLISRIAPSKKPVLVSGESGVGKSYFASQVHRSSKRSENPLFAINCSALQGERVAERELFGFAQGAFEGANVPREGVLVKADGGTVVLEEVGDLSLSAQAKLLNYLETGEIRRLGENVPIVTNTRIIATTRKDLNDEIEENRFRPDLLFRLKSIAMDVPPLRERKEDISLLTDHFLKKYRRRGGPHYRLTKEALSALSTYAYPGNVRELKNSVEQVLLLSKGPVIDLIDLERAGLMMVAPKEGPMQKIALTEKEVLQEVIDRHPRNLEAAALELELSRTTLWRRMKKYGMLRRD